MRLRFQGLESKCKDFGFVLLNPILVSSLKCLFYRLIFLVSSFCMFAL